MNEGQENIVRSGARERHKGRAKATLWECQHVGQGARSDREQAKSGVRCRSKVGTERLWQGNAVGVQREQSRNGV